MTEESASRPFPTPDVNRFWWAQSVSTLSFARWLPYLLFGLLVGAFVDRYRRRPLMVAADLARAVLLVVIPVAWATDLLSLPLLLVVVACFGLASLIGDAAATSFLPRIVPTAQLQQAHARIDTTDAVAQSAGPALAGLLVKLVGAPLAVLVDAAVVFLAVTAALFVSPIRTLRYDAAGVGAPG